MRGIVSKLLMVCLIGAWMAPASAQTSIEDIEQFAKIAGAKGYGKISGDSQIVFYAIFSNVELIRKDFKLVFADRLCSGAAIGESDGTVDYVCNDDSAFRGRFSCTDSFCRLDIRDAAKKRFKYNLTLSNSLYTDEILALYAPAEQKTEYAALVTQQIQKLAGKDTSVQVNSSVTSVVTYASYPSIVIAPLL